MIPPNERNPFTPSHGAIPPEYVGRETEQTELLARLAILRQGRSPSDNVIDGLRERADENNDGGGRDMRPETSGASAHISHYQVMRWLRRK